MTEPASANQRSVEDSPPPQPPIPDQCPATPELTTAQLADLTDESKQAEYRKQYLLQLAQRRGCIGCGD